MKLAIIFLMIFSIIVYCCYWSTNENFTPIHIISLERSNDRKEKYHKVIMENEIKFNYFNAVDGKKLTPAEIQMKKKYIEGALNDGQIGCFLSHVALLKLLLEKPFNDFIILEDDITIESFEYFKNIEQFIIPDYDVIFLGHCFEKRGDTVKNVDDKFEICKSVGPACTHAYLISKKGIRKILESMDGVSFTVPIDRVYEKFVKLGKIKSYSVFPQLISQGWQNNEINEIPSLTQS